MGSSVEFESGAALSNSSGKSFTSHPIGYFQSPQVAPYEAGRQPDPHHAEGVIELLSGENFEQALEGLNPGQRIWILFQFHHNHHWNPKVLPPRGGNKKIGVFATRSPYRPNAIGMSTVEILKIEGLKIFVSASDLLDGTPILDIKPYISYADSFTDQTPDWLLNTKKFAVVFSENAQRQIQHLEDHGLTQLRGFLEHQLEFEPTNHKKKRVKPDQSLAGVFVIAYKTWRAQFSKVENEIHILKIFSGYSELDLQSLDDPYSDKSLHREFNLAFN